MNASRVIVVAAPSGAGKGTLVARVRKALPSIAVTTSATTRPPRAGEVDGREYFFLSREEFERKIAVGEFAEWAEVHGNLYGTLKSEVDRHLSSGEAVLFELDVQGMRSMKRQYPELVSVFIAPPSMEELQRRLVHRGTNDDADMALRLENAEREMACRDEFDHVIVNDDIDRAADRLEAIVQG